MPKPRALISVSDKTGIVPLATGLAARGYQVVSTGGTARALEDAGVGVTPISDVTGFPEILDGRVKTLHPAVHGGILARRRRAEDLAVVAHHGIALIDIVAVNLYPFVKAAARSDIKFDALVEEIDIGGPSMVRSAAKNFQDVLVVVDPADYETVLAELDRAGGPTRDFRFELARKAFAHTAAYDAAIAATLSEYSVSADGFARTGQGESTPGRLAIGLNKIKNLRYGENPHQAAAWYAADQAFGLGAADVLQGKELSFTNLLDLDSAARIALEFSEPAAVVIKHTNPCGAAVGPDVTAAYVRARDADSLAAFGGIVGLNRPIDEQTARALVSTFIEAVIAPGVTEAARPILATRAKMRVVVADLNASPATALGRLDLRSILGAVLAQERDTVAEARVPWTPSSVSELGLKVATRREPTAAEWNALRFAWRVCAHVKSNAVIFTDAESTLAIGAGQMSRVDAVQVAVMKAGGSSRLAGSVAASDAYFPFRDGLDALAAAGATAVVQPGGSVRDADVVAAANEHGLAMVFTGRRHFRH
jgi:phosphoribosylaminoimidazolecarboxamide formyltransferase / IMP cyclohydrolase